MKKIVFMAAIALTTNVAFASEKEDLCVFKGTVKYVASGEVDVLGYTIEACSNLYETKQSIWQAEAFGGQDVVVTRSKVGKLVIEK